MKPYATCLPAPLLAQVSSLREEVGSLMAHAGQLEAKLAAGQADLDAKVKHITSKLPEVHLTCMCMRKLSS